MSTVWGLAAGVGTLSLPLAEQAVMHGILWMPGLLVGSLALLSLIFLIRLSPQNLSDLKKDKYTRMQATEKTNNSPAY